MGEVNGVEFYPKKEENGKIGTISFNDGHEAGSEQATDRLKAVEESTE